MTSSPQTVLLTGANRGLGLEMARQYAHHGWRVLATCRNPERAKELQDLAGGSCGKVEIAPLDVADLDAIQSLAQRWKKRTIDVLINNAGLYGDRIDGDRMPLGQIDYEAWARTIRVNTMGPLAMVESFLDAVARSGEKKIVTITSRMGSIGDNTSGGTYLYRSSKAAVNAVTKSLAIDLAPRGMMAVVLHPGWVATDMGGHNAPLSVEDSVTGMRNVIASLGPGQSGGFFLHDGTELPW